MTGNDALIQVRGLVNRFGNQTVHDGLDLDIRRGEILGVVGGSGTGKSVLLRSIVGLRRPNAGSVSVFAASRRKEMRLFGLKKPTPAALPVGYCRPQIVPGGMVVSTFSSSLENTQRCPEARRFTAEVLSLSIL